MTRIWTFVLGFALPFAMTFAAQSASAAETHSIHVTSADLRLDNPRDQNLLDRRISRAAGIACGTPSNIDLVGQRMARKCRAEAAARVAPRRQQLIARAPRFA